MPRYFRRVLRVTAEDSPNVRLALEQQAAGLVPTGEEKVPGVLSWDAYCKRRALWDEIRQCVGLDARWYVGAAQYLFPAELLDACHAFASAHDPRLRPDLKRRKAKGVGVDPAEGGDKTALCAVDEWGVLPGGLEVHQTTDTNEVPGLTRAFCAKHQADPWDVVFDTGGGGKQHADRLRAEGFPCRSVHFGESPTPPLEAVKQYLADRKDAREDRGAYKNKRVQMVYELHLLCDPNAPSPRRGRTLAGFGLPRGMTELRRQLAPLPLDYDGEGKLVLPPKRRGPGVPRTVKTLEEILGCSPDESDALVLATYALLHPERRPYVGPLWAPDGTPLVGTTAGGANGTGGYN